MTGTKFKNKGFTLIELIVVMAVFLFVIGITITIFISIVLHQKAVLAEQEFLSQISYVQEYMSKALRMASVATDDSCIPKGYSYLLTKGIKFINQSDIDLETGEALCQEFFLDAGGILKEKRGSEPAVALVSKNLKINYIKFVINGSDGSCSDSNLCGAKNTDNIQPRVTMLLSVKIPGDNQDVERIIQTTISQRNLNK
jgi:prepilin-type N-terminal cleavage/methylation domain-containing protein